MILSFGHYKVALLLMVMAVGTLALLSERTDVAQPSRDLSFFYEHGKPFHALRDGEFRIHQASLKPFKGDVFVRATLGVPDSNPAPYLDGHPTGLQFVILGQRVAGKFIPAIRFGIHEGERMNSKEAQLVPWVFDGHINYYGGYARPATLYDFQIELSTAKSRATVMTLGRGDDDWFLLAEEIPLLFPVSEINEVQVEQRPGAAGVHRLSLDLNPHSQGAASGSDGLNGRRRTVGVDGGFRLQAMRSVWRKRGRHVTISRDERRWQGFADVVLSKSGRLLTTYCDGPKHGGNGQAVIRSSDDLGMTWSPETVMEATRGANERLQRLADGSLLFISGEMLPTVEFQQSVDDGKSWRVIGGFDVRSFGLKQHFAMSHVLESSDGTWLIVGSDMVERDERERLQVFASANKGKNWELRALIDTYSRSGHGGSEASILELADGRLVIYARESRNDGFPGFRVFSSDKGKTWSDPEDLPIQVSGRVLADFLPDGRVMLTTRTWMGRPALWAWVEDPRRSVGFQISGIHFNDKSSKGLKDGALVIDNDGKAGQFTRYLLRPPNGPEDKIVLKSTVMVLENQGRAATISVPFAGRLSIFPTYVTFTGKKQENKLEIKPREFHTYRLQSGGGRVTLHIDDKLVLDTADVDDRQSRNSWSPSPGSPLLFAFGNYPSPEVYPPDIGYSSTAMYPFQITPEVTGLSYWRSVDVAIDYSNGNKHHTSWVAARDGFPDQYQLDHVIEVEASIAGIDQGYSGWTRLPDGRLFVVNYTDDTAVIWPPTRTSPYRCSWIRGTYLFPGDLQ